MSAAPLREVISERSATSERRAYDSGAWRNVRRAKRTAAPLDRGSSCGSGDGRGRRSCARRRVPRRRGDARGSGPAYAEQIGAPNARNAPRQSRTLTVGRSPFRHRAHCRRRPSYEPYDSGGDRRDDRTATARTMAGLSAAKRRGERPGRRPALTPARVAQARKMLADATPFHTSPVACGSADQRCIVTWYDRYVRTELAFDG